MSIGRSQFASDVEYQQALRDYFAAKAMVGIFTFWCEVQERTKKNAIQIDDPAPDMFARMAYEYADAMIRARTNPRGETK